MIEPARSSPIITSPLRSTSVIQPAHSSPIVTSPLRSTNPPTTTVVPTPSLLNLPLYPTVTTPIKAGCADCGKYKNRIAKNCPEGCCPDHCAQRFLKNGSNGQRCVPHGRHIANALALHASLVSSSFTTRATRSTAAAAVTASTPSIEENRAMPMGIPLNRHGSDLYEPVDRLPAPSSKVA